MVPKLSTPSFAAHTHPHEPGIQVHKVSHTSTTLHLMQLWLAHECIAYTVARHANYHVRSAHGVYARDRYFLPPPPHA